MDNKALSTLTKEIQKAVGQYCLDKFHYPVIENISNFPCVYSSHEMDIMSISKSGMVYEYEVKVSKSDFKADLKKFKHDFFNRASEHSPNYFSYVCPKDLISLNEIPSYAGLYYYEDGYVFEIKRPKQITKKNHDLPKLKEKILRVFSERMFYGCSRLTKLNRDIMERNQEHIKE